MILSRRKAHFYASVGLAGLLPIIFLAGLIWRPSIPTVGDETDDLFAVANFAQPEETSELAAETLSIAGRPTAATLVESESGELALILQPSRTIPFSDVLVYWVAGDAPPETVPEDAILLGQLAGTSRRQFPVVTEMQAEPGQLLFYSRSQGVAIATVQLPASFRP